MPQEIWRTVFTIEVFSEGPFELDPEPTLSDLAQIDYAITEGDCIGAFEEAESSIVPPEEVEGELQRIGNDGHFFDAFDLEAADDDD